MCLSRLHPEGNGVVRSVCRDICPFDYFVLFGLVRAYSYIFCRGTIETMWHTEVTQIAQDTVPGCLVGLGLVPEAKAAVTIAIGSPRSTSPGPSYWPTESCHIRVRIGCSVRNSALVVYCPRPIAAIYSNHPSLCRRALGKEKVVSIPKNERSVCPSVSVHHAAAWVLAFFFFRAAHQQAAAARMLCTIYMVCVVQQQEVKQSTRATRTLVPVQYLLV